MPKVSNEKKNLTRLAGEFLVASRLAQRGYMVSLQWGTTIGYDLLVFDKRGKVVFIEVKTSASNRRQWVLQKKYATPETSPLSVDKRFVCCVDLTSSEEEPDVFVFPASVISKGLHYYFNNRFPNSSSYNLSLEKRPQGRTKDKTAKTVGDFIRADEHLENYDIIGIEPVKR